jgi:RNA polymerase sigma-70 factor (ECF subfamily)
VSALAVAHAPGLLAYFTRRVQQRDDAADLLGETMLVLWRRVADVPSDEQAARLWLYGVARRVLATHRRTGTRRHALTERLRTELATTAHKQSSQDPRLEELQRAFETLHPIDQEIIKLVHWDGFSLVDAARVMGRRPGTIRSRYHRARTLLRAQLKAPEPVPERHC